MDPTAWDPIVWAWIDFSVRWLHVIAGIAWIGSLLLLRPLASSGGASRPARGVGGEAWQVHGGGFHHMKKYVVAPELPED